MNTKIIIIIIAATIICISWIFVIYKFISKYNNRLNLHQIHNIDNKKITTDLPKSKVIYIVDNKFGDIEPCSICLESFNVGKVIQFSCTHIFHENCYENWSKECIKNENPTTCPTCRNMVCFIVV